MLTSKLKQQIRSSFDGAKTQLSNFNNRSSQNKMIAEISKTLMGEYSDSNRIICVEAPTGTGKTMAYLVSCLPVAKELIKNIKPKAIGQEIIRSTTPGQMIVKVVYNEVVKILGDSKSEVNLNAVPPICLMLVGLQGSGKTTTAAKLAKYLEKNNKKKLS